VPVFAAGAEGREAKLEESGFAASGFAASVATLVVAESLTMAAFCGKQKTRSAAARNIWDTSVAAGSITLSPATHQVCCPKGQVALAHWSHFSSTPIERIS
jgi:hypothetical protein